MNRAPEQSAPQANQGSPILVRLRSLKLVIVVLIALHSLLVAIREHREAIVPAAWVTQAVTALRSERQFPIRVALREEPTLLVFFTTWCSYCPAELRRARELLGEAEALGIQVYFINVGETREVVESFEPLLGLGDVVLLDQHGALAKSLRIDSYPSFVALDSRSRIRWRARGLQPRVAERVAIALGLNTG